MALAQKAAPKPAAKQTSAKARAPKRPDWHAEDRPVAYERALAFMEAKVGMIRDKGDNDYVWLLEHPPVYTAGTSADPKDLINARFPVHAAGRGGQYTYHGPGQRVAYVMMDLQKREPDLKNTSTRWRNGRSRRLRSLMSRASAVKGASESGST